MEYAKILVKQLHVDQSILDQLCMLNIISNEERSDVDRQVSWENRTKCLLGVLAHKNNVKALADCDTLRHIDKHLLPFVMGVNNEDMINVLQVTPQPPAEVKYKLYNDDKYAIQVWINHRNSRLLHTDARRMALQWASKSIAEYMSYDTFNACRLADYLVSNDTISLEEADAVYNNPDSEQLNALFRVLETKGLTALESFISTFSYPWVLRVSKAVLQHNGGYKLTSEIHIEFNSTFDAAFLSKYPYPSPSDVI